MKNLEVTSLTSRSRQKLSGKTDDADRLMIGEK
jgi:hypothetical protein